MLKFLHSSSILKTALFLTIILLWDTLTTEKQGEHTMFLDEGTMGDDAGAGTGDATTTPQEPGSTEEAQS